VYFQQQNTAAKITGTYDLNYRVSLICCRIPAKRCKPDPKVEVAGLKHGGTRFNVIPDYYHYCRFQLLFNGPSLTSFTSISRRCSLANPSDALHHGKRAANKGGRSL